MFQLLARDIDISKALAELEARPVLWTLFTGRQDTEGSPHHATECIVLRGPAVPDLRSVFTDLVCYDYPVLQALPETLTLLHAVFSDPGIPDFALGRVMVVKLQAGGRIDPHSDEGIYAEYYDTRLHLVLSSEEGNAFSCGSETVRMRPGDLWKFDHRQLHSAVNDSNLPRVHVIIDGRTVSGETP